MLVSSGRGSNIMTARKFGDFILHVEFNCAPKSNSGVYVRERKPDLAPSSPMALDQLIAVYAEAVEEARVTEGWDLQGEDRAAAAYLRRWGGLLRERAKLGRFRTELARIQGSAKRRARTLLLRAPAGAQLYRALSRMVRRVSRAPGGPGRPDAGSGDRAGSSALTADACETPGG